MRRRALFFFWTAACLVLQHTGRATHLRIPPSGVDVTADTIKTAKDFVAHATWLFKAKVQGLAAYAWLTHGNAAAPTPEEGKFAAGLGQVRCWGAAAAAAYVVAPRTCLAASCDVAGDLFA